MKVKSRYYGLWFWGFERWQLEGVTSNLKLEGCSWPWEHHREWALVREKRMCEETEGKKESHVTRRKKREAWRRALNESEAEDAKSCRICRPSRILRFALNAVESHRRFFKRLMTWSSLYSKWLLWLLNESRLEETQEWKKRSQLESSYSVPEKDIDGFNNAVALEIKK